MCAGGLHRRLVRGLLPETAGIPGSLLPQLKVIVLRSQHVGCSVRCDGDVSGLLSSNLS